MVRFLNIQEHGRDKTDLKAIFVHLGAFGLYLLSAVITVAVVALQGFGVIQKYGTVYYIADHVTLLFSFVSQLLVCVIFVVLSRPDEIVEEQEASIEVQEFDDDAELQTRMWAQFIR